MNNLSICMTCKNRSKLNTPEGNLYLLPNCIDSIIEASKDLDINIEIVISDWNSTDWPLKEWLPEKLDKTGISYKIVNISKDKFDAGYGRNVAAKNASFYYMFFLDADMLLDKEVMQDAIKALKENKIFFPMCRNEDTLEIRNTGYGNLGISKSNYYLIGEWDKRKKWGGEDTDYYYRCMNSKRDIVRSFYFDFIHQWHPKRIGWDMQINKKGNESIEFDKKEELRRKIKILKKIKKEINE